MQPEAVLYPSLQQPVPIVVVAPETITLDKWEGKFPSQVYGIEFLEQQWLYTDPARLLDAEFPYVDKWLANYPDMIIPRPEPVETWYSQDPHRMLDAEFPSVDKWLASYPDLIIRPEFLEAPWVFTDNKDFATAETITLDKWLSKYPDEVYGIKFQEQQWFFPDPARLLDAEFPSVDKWLAKYDDFIFPLRQPVEEWYAQDPTRMLDAEFPSIDKWLAKYPDQLFTLKGLEEHQFHFLVEGDLRIVPLVQALYPDYLLVRPPVEEWFTIDPRSLLQAEYPFVDKWKALYPDIVERHKGLEGFDFFMLDLGDLRVARFGAVYPDLLIPYPYMDMTHYTIVAQNFIAETVTVDKWFQPASQPYEVYRYLVDYTGWYYWDPNSGAIITPLRSPNSSGRFVTPPPPGGGRYMVIHPGTGSSEGPLIGFGRGSRIPDGTGRGDVTPPPATGASDEQYN